MDLRPCYSDKVKISLEGTGLERAKVAAFAQVVLNPKSGEAHKLVILYPADENGERLGITVKDDNGVETTTLLRAFYNRRATNAKNDSGIPATVARIVLDMPFSSFTWPKYAGARGQLVEAFVKKVGGQIRQ